MTEEESYDMVREEAKKIGGSVHWFPASGHECSGASSSPHVMRDGVSHEIPYEAWACRQQFRLWLRSAFPSHRQPRSATPYAETQLTLNW